MKIFAHRGSSLIWPENTLSAFDQAHACDAAGFETDLRLSHDGEIILSHDDELSRVGVKGKRISALKAADICQLTIFSANGRCKDKLITLENLLTRYPDKDYIFDCKIANPQLMEKLKSLLETLHFHDKIWFLSWSRSADECVRDFFPAAPFFPRENRTRAWGLLSLIGLGRLAEPTNTILALPAYHAGLPLFDTKQIRSMEERGKQFMGYLVNSRRDFIRCVESGVRQVLTDRPDLISGYLRERPAG